MTDKHATVKAPLSGLALAEVGGSPEGGTSPGGEAPAPAEAIRRRLADAWGQIGAAWGIAPAVARVHGYLLASRSPLTEREIRAALGLSHRAAALALAESEAWGLVERLSEPRRSGRRGPAGTAYVAIGDHWRWFGRVVAQRKLREGDPTVAALESASAEAHREAAAQPGDAELTELAAWLADFLAFVRLFDRAIGIVPGLEPRQVEAGLRLLGALSDETVRRLIALGTALPADDLVPLLEALAELSPAQARTLLGPIGRLVRLGRGRRPPRV